MLRIVQPARTARSRQISRRELLAIGAGGLGALTLPGLLRADAAAGNGRSNKAIIFVHLDGGPPQMDTIDLKPHAPSEVRGEFAPINSAISGTQVCELLPKLAANAERFSFIRSLVGSDGRHHAFQCQSGFLEKDMQSLGGRPALGCVVSKLEGRPDDPAPTYVDVMQGRPLVRNSARPGFLGPAYAPFRPDISHLFQRELEPGMQGELRRLGDNHKLSLTLNTDLTVERIDDRQSLLAGLDRVRRDVDASGMMEAMDRFHQQATGILTSGRLAEALDLDREDPEVTSRYLDGNIPAADLEHYTADGPRATLKFLMARRLIEAGARVVSLTISDFDTHSNNFGRMRQALPIVDHGLTTLVADLDERGLLDDVTIVAWGEFGRTPTINGKAGRDHWPRVGPCLLAGGGLRTGQVIGETDRYAAEVRSRPVTYKDVFCTLYRQLGIDARGITLPDPQGRPQYILDEGEPIAELV